MKNYKQEYIMKVKNLIHKLKIWQFKCYSKKLIISIVLSFNNFRATFELEIERSFHESNVNF